MMRDPVVNMTLNQLADPLSAARWFFDPPPNATPLDLEVADFLQWAFIERHAWRQLIRRTVRSYAAYGCELLEVTDDALPIPTSRFPNHPGGGVGIAPTGFHQRPTSTITKWHKSPTNGAQLQAVEQLLHSSDKEPIGYVRLSSGRLMRFSYDQEGAYYPGNAILRPAYQPWKLKIAFLSIMGIKHERTGVGTPSLTLPDMDPADADIEAAVKILSEMRAHEKGFLLLPNGYEFEWQGAGEGDTSNIEAAIAYCDSAILYNISAGFMNLGQNDNSGGSYALGITQQDAFHLFVEQQAAFLTDAINIGQDGQSFVERYVRLNYGPNVAVPRLKARNLPTRPWLAILDMINQSAVTGVITLDDRLEVEARDVMGLPPHDPTTARAKPSNLGTPEADEETDEETEDEGEE